MPTTPPFWTSAGAFVPLWEMVPAGRKVRRFSMMPLVSTVYQTKVSAGEIMSDAAQVTVLHRFDHLVRELSKTGAPPRGGFPVLGLRRRPKVPLRGLYLYGAVGAGKTLLMDLFFSCVPTQPKRRVHFHAFMCEVHERICRGRSTTEGDPIPYVAKEIAGEASLLCFDEFHVTDIADAMILGRLFKGLFEERVLVVATSNVEPDNLYWNGLNRQLFLPFITMIKDHCDVVGLVAQKDYRIEKLVGEKLYFSPANEDARHQIERHWHRLTEHHPATPAHISYKGRTLFIPLSARGVARFQFQDLCGCALGSGDYLELARHYHTFFLENIPVLTPDRRNEARRFIHLIDTLYDNRICVIASAEAEPSALYPRGEGADLFQRTASRLLEMRSVDYVTSCFGQKTKV